MKPDKKIIFALNRPLGIIKMPFAAAARRIGWSEARFLAAVKDHKRQGLIRRLGLILAHRRIGVRSNVLVAWKVAEKDILRSAKVFANSAEISHCYQRKAYSVWPYNIYTMIHGRSREECLKTIRKLSGLTGVKDYRELFTLKELKKTKADIWLMTEKKRKGSFPG